MLKTSRRSLSTAMLALCLLITQALLFAQSSGTTHAAAGTGPAIFVNPGSITRSGGNDVLNSTYITVSGTGFASLATVKLTFNAPYSADGEPLSPRTIPPAIARPGDNRVSPPRPATGTFPNAIVVCAVTDANGNLISAGTSLIAGAPVCVGQTTGITTTLGIGTPGTAVQIPIPNTAVDGTYEVTAVDSTGLTAATQFTINRQPTPDMTATPISGPSVPIEGLVQIHIRPEAFQSNSPVYFYLTNFDLNALSAPPATPNVQTGVQLPVTQCGTFTTGGPSINGNLSYTDTCLSDAHGGVTAVVQVQALPPPPAGSTFLPGYTGPYDPILSTQYFDQVFAIVAMSQPWQGTFPTNAISYTAGIHLDHGLTQLSLSTNQVALGGAFVVSGTGFGAYAHVNLYYVPLNGTTASSPVLCGLGIPTTVSGCTDQTAPYFYTPYLLGSATTDGNGSFTNTLGLSLSQFGSLGLGVAGTGGFILAEDFSSWYPIGQPDWTTEAPNYGYIPTDPFGGAPRLNEAATAAVSLIGSTGTGASLLISSQVSSLGIGASVGGAGYGAAATTATAAISSTVIVTGTGFLPNEAVDVTIAGPSASSTILPFGAPFNPPSGPGGPVCPTETVAVAHANASGTAIISFQVPETCNTVTEDSGGRANAGTATGPVPVAVSAVGEQDGRTDSATLNIPATTALITPNPSTLNPAGQGGVVTLSGSGFAANENVTFQFGSVDPFSGILTTPLFTVYNQSDAAGNVTIPAVNLPASLTGGLYTLVARGLNSGFFANVSTSFPFIYVNGNLNCPATAVLPGQIYTVTGTNFLAGSPILVTLTPQSPTAASLTTPIPVPIFSTSTNALNGTFTVTPTVPLGTPAGQYVLSITGLVANATGGNFQEQLRECIITVGTSAPTISVTPTTASIGQSVTVTGSGFAPSEQITLELQYIDNTGVLTGTLVPGTDQPITTTSTTGTFTVSYPVASRVNALIPGTYNLTAIGSQIGVNTNTAGTVVTTGALARTPLTVTAEPQPPANTVYFAEGYTGTVAAGANADFVETLSILNANNYTTTYTVTYFLEAPISSVGTPNGVAGGTSSTKVYTGTLAPYSVVERSVNTDVGLNQEVAAEVSSPSPLGVERIINRSNAGKALDSDSSLGQLLDLTSTASSFSYYFAGGEMMLTNEEYLTLLNPTSTVANVSISILPEAVISATSVPTIAPITATVQGNSRLTVPIRRLVEKAVSAQIKFGMTVTSNVPLAAERVEYFGNGIGSGKYGATAKPGASSLFRQYIFASDVGTFPSSGGTPGSGTGNDVSQVDVINPGPAAGGSATVTVSFFDKSGNAINSQQVQVDGGTRETVNVNDVVGTQTDVFSVIVTSDKNVYVELPIFYGGDPNNGGTFAAAEPAGAPSGLTSVAFPNLDITSPTGAAISQTVYLYNPGAYQITVRATYVSSVGGTTVLKTYTVAPNSILPVSVNTDSATLPAGARGAIFQIVYVGTNQYNPNNGASFVAQEVQNSADFSNVVGNTGTYPIGAATAPFQS